MKTSETKSSTGSISESNFIRQKPRLGNWFKIWWPIPIFLVILIVAGFSKYFLQDEILTSIMFDLIKAVGLLLVLLYVIYTRLLALETKSMADASKGLYSSEKGTVLAESIVSVCDYNKLPEEVKEVSKKIHLNEKKWSEKEFQGLFSEKELPAISLNIKNICARRIELREIKYEVRHTGNYNNYPVTCNISHIGKILPWEDKSITLVVAPEGEVEVTIISINFMDGDILKPANIVSDKKVLPRIPKPEKSSNG